jgi:thioredoxin
MQMGTEIFHNLKKVLHDRGLSTAVGDEGGFAPDLASNEEAVEIIIEAITKAGYKAGDDIMIAIDAASSEFYIKEEKVYHFHQSDGRKLSSEQMADFWAEWCGPCVMMSSIIEKFAAESKNIKVIKVNADFNKNIIEKYQIRGLPQFILVKDGKEIKRFAGAMTKSDLIKFCDDKND